VFGTQSGFELHGEAIWDGKEPIWE
jgi:hypothetical protein